jgi:hypothetical protein
MGYEFTIDTWESVGECCGLINQVHRILEMQRTLYLAHPWQWVITSIPEAKCIAPDAPSAVYSLQTRFCIFQVIDCCVAVIII